MPDKIFLLPDAGAPIAGDARTRHLALLVGAIPEDWSDVSGLLESPDPQAAQDTGYEFHRNTSGIRMVARQRRDPTSEIVRPDPIGILVGGQAPGFISFRETGYGCSKMRRPVAPSEPPGSDAGPVIHGLHDGATAAVGVQDA